VRRWIGFCDAARALQRSVRAGSEHSKNRFGMFHTWSVGNVPQSENEASTGVSVDPVARTARVPAGAVWSDVIDAVAPYGLSQALVAELPLRRLTLLKAIQAHAPEDAGRFRELDLSVIDDLDVVAPRIVEVKRSGSLDLDAAPLHRAADRLLVIDDQAKVPRTIGQLGAPGRQRDELIAQVDESHPPADSAAQFELEEPPVPVKRLIKIPDLQRYMVDTDEPCHLPSCSPITGAVSTDKRPHARHGSCRCVTLEAVSRPRQALDHAVGERDRLDVPEHEVGGVEELGVLGVGAFLASGEHEHVDVAE